MTCLSSDSLEVAFNSGNHMDGQRERANREQGLINEKTKTERTVLADIQVIGG